MSNRYDNDKGHIFECDPCGDEIIPDEHDFHIALAAIRNEGWRAFKDHQDEWNHACSSCVKDFKNDAKANR